jgi:hypothetical protein
MKSAERRRPWWAGPLAAGLGYAGLVGLWTWPLPAHLGDQAVLARGSDFYPHIWNLWWMREALFTLHQNPYTTTYLNYPTGMPLTYHVLDPLDGLLALPLQAAVGLLAAFNLLRLGQMIFAAAAMAALGRTLRLPGAAAFAAGALFAFCPLVGTSFDLGQLVEISVGWLPLTILCTIRALGNRALGIRAGGWGWLLAAGLSLAASALSTWYFFTALLLFIVLYVAWELGGTWLRRGGDETYPPSADRLGWSGRLVARAAGIGIVAGVLLSPLILALLRESATGADYMFPSLETIIANSADLVSFFLPLPAHYTDPVINPHGGNPALGWTALALAAVGLLAGRRGGVGGSPPVFWAVAAGVFAVLALGPHLLVGGTDTQIPMPYLLLNKLPFVGAARVPVRFVLIVSLAVAVLAGYGLWALARAVRPPAARAALFTGLAALVAVEFLGIPRTLFTPTADPFFATIAAPGAAGSDEAVLELPQAIWTAPAMFDQTVHGRPIIGGYTARHYPYPWVRATPGVAQLTQPDLPLLDAPDILSPAVDATALAALDYYGVRYVAVHPLGGAGAEAKIRTTVNAIFAGHQIAPIYQTASLTAYRVPPQPQTGPFLGLGDGWYQVEEANGRRWRWLGDDAQVQVTNPLTGTLAAQVRLAGFTLGDQRTLLARLDGQEVARQPIGPPPAQAFAIPLDLTPGEHWLALQSLEPPVAPPGDRRALSLAFEQIAVEVR